MYADPNSLYGTARRKQWPSETKSLQGNEGAYLPQYTSLSFSETNEFHDELYHQAPIDVNLPYQFKLPHYRHLDQTEPPFIPKRVIRLPSLVPATSQISPRRPVAMTEAKIDHENKVENRQLEDPFTASMLDGGDEGMCPWRPEEAEMRPIFESVPTEYSSSSDGTVAIEDTSEDSDGVSIPVSIREQTLLNKYDAFKNSQYKRCSVRICAVINQNSVSKSMIKGERRTVRKACFRACQLFKGKAKDLEIENRVIQSLRDDGSLNKFLNRPLAKNGGKKEANDQSTGASMGSPQEKSISVNRSPRSPRGSLDDPWVTQEENKSEKGNGK